jgi:hypothetical protein
MLVMGTCSTQMNQVDERVVAAIPKLMDVTKLMDGNAPDKKDAVKKVEDYAKLVNMNQANTDAMKVFVTQGPAAGMKHMMTNPTTGKEWSYAESRAMYG